MTPPILTNWFLSLPPILYIQNRNPILNYSKALRGLSVLPRVIRIFTHTSISPGPLSRQRPNRYAIHAGQNLPDKEFRYLRTVIVTAAVHWGLSSGLRRQYSWLFLLIPLTFQHRAGVSSYTSSCDFAETCVFGKQSLGPLHCGLCLHRHLFSRSYEVILQSSLTMVLPFVLHFSCRLPVSVCGTGTLYLFSRFSRQREFIDFITNFHSPSSPSILITSVLHYLFASWFGHGFPSPWFYYPSASRLQLFIDTRWYRNIYLLSITYGFRPQLRSWLTLGGLPFPRKP